MNQEKLKESILGSEIDFCCAPKEIGSLLESLLEKDPEKRVCWEKIWECELFKKLHKKIVIRD
jgi:hypothetical protein